MRGRRRVALREIVMIGDLVNENGHTYLVARVSSETSIRRQGKETKPLI